MNRQPEPNTVEIADAAWPSTRAGEALHALARHVGLPVDSLEAVALPNSVLPEQLDGWIESAAARAGLQVDQAFISLDEIDHLITYSAPALLRLAALDTAPFLAVVERRRRFVYTLGPDLRIHRLDVKAVSAVVRQPFEAQMEGDIDQVLGRMTLFGCSRSRARGAMLADRLKSTRFRGCWLVRLPPGAEVADEAREAGMPRRAAILIGAHVAQFVLFILSWWLLGRGVLSGTMDRGWLSGWLLLLASLIPLRLVTTWNQGVAAVSIGTWLRRRLLRGAFMMDRQELRQKGGGQLFGLVIEAAAIDALALTGGVLAVFSLVELALASAVL